MVYQTRLVSSLLPGHDYYTLTMRHGLVILPLPRLISSVLQSLFSFLLFSFLSSISSKLDIHSHNMQQVLSQAATALGVEGIGKTVLVSGVTGFVGTGKNELPMPFVGVLP